MSITRCMCGIRPERAWKRGDCTYAYSDLDRHTDIYVSPVHFAETLDLRTQAQAFRKRLK